MRTYKERVEGKDFGGKRWAKLKIPIPTSETVGMGVRTSIQTHEEVKWNASKQRWVSVNP